MIKAAMIHRKRISILKQALLLGVTIQALLFCSAVKACDGCFDDWFAPYFQRYDGVTLGGGNAKDQNAISEYMDADSETCSQTVCPNGCAGSCKDRKAGRRHVPGLNGQSTIAGFGGPLPPYVLDRGIPLNGQRAVGAMERYRDTAKYYGFSKAPIAGSTSTTPPPPANGTVTGGTQQ